MVNNSFDAVDIQSLPLVSIGIPFFNASAYLGSAIKSVLNQSYNNWELILVDDGSTDNSLAVARQFKDPRISIISDGKNLGLVHRLNQITSIAKGELLARMDADDIMHTDRIKQQVAYKLRHPEVDILGTAYCIIDKSDQIKGISATVSDPASGSSIFSGEFIAHPTVMAKRTWFLQNPYQEGFYRAEDRELWVRVRGVTTFHNLTDPLLFYRVYEKDLKKYTDTNRSVIKLFARGIFKHDIPVFTASFYILTYSLKTILYSLINIFHLSSIFKKISYRTADKTLLDTLSAELGKATKTVTQ